jgi:hypothetical protein
VGNENEHPVSNPNRTMINMTNELNDVHKNIFQRGNNEWAHEKLMKKLQDHLNRM